MSEIEWSDQAIYIEYPKSLTDGQPIPFRIKLTPPVLYAPKRLLKRIKLPKEST